eukprot:TRINITY_DN1160_c0_g1_i1.p1 TRINITY_DN1160_c0_g1~~TRINITY_DN1160_c0_g1_i1.p1  ORF type:complete len:528 (-),score=120.68 TRINITY_DN1160_c0_g1_i1:180-1763(-)
MDISTLAEPFLHRPDDQPVNFIATMDIELDKLEETKELMKKLSILTKQEPECRYCAIWQDKDVPTRFIFCLEFANKAAWEAHKSRPDIRALKESWPGTPATFWNVDTVTEVKSTKPLSSSGSDSAEGAPCLAPPPKPHTGLHDCECDECLKCDEEMKKWLIPMSELKFLGQVGQGAFGVVHKSLWNGVPVVVKRDSATTAGPVIVRDALCHEIERMINIRPHPNVVQMLGIVLEPEQPVCLVMEYVDGGSLLDLLSKPTREVSTAVAMLILRDVAAGMLHLHSVNVLHADLAARNVLLVAKGNHYQAKVADFGLSHEVTNNSTYQLAKGRLVPTRWSPPEVLRSKDEWSREADVWSFGCVIYEVFERQIPYANFSVSLVSDMVVSGSLKLSLSETSRVPHPPAIDHMMRSCLHPDSSRRPAFRDLHHLLVEEAESHIDALFSSLSMANSDSMHLTSADSNSGSSSSSLGAPPADAGAYDDDSEPPPAVANGWMNSVPDPKLQYTRSAGLGAKLGSEILLPEDVGYVD